MFRIREIDHLVLRVYDIERMRRFYCDVLGAEHIAWRPEHGMSHLRVGRSMVDLITLDGPLGKPGGAGPAKEGRNVDHFCFRVEPFDQEAIVAHLKKHGASQVVMGEYEIAKTMVASLPPAPAATKISPNN